MRDRRFLTGFRKGCVYLLVALHVALRYALRPSRFAWSVPGFSRFLYRALRLLLLFRHNKVVRTASGYKLHLYLPAWPSRAFFHAVESKLLWPSPAPVTVVFSMTKACRYDCRHCYQRLDGGKDLQLEDVVSTASAVQDAGVAFFDIEGGEPFVRFKRLLSVVDALDDRSEVWVNTSGDKVTAERLRTLRERGVAGLFISVHSPDPAVNDDLTRTKGSLDNALGAARLARGEGLAVAFNSVLSEDEIEKGALDDLMDLAKTVDADYVQLIHPKPSGKWLSRRDAMQRSRRVIGRIVREHVRYNGPSTKAYPALAAQAFEESPRVFGCTAGGIDRFYVNAAGEVQPCEFVNLSLGNVRDEPFHTIMSRMRSLFPLPHVDWLCCNHADSISEALEREEGTPVRWPRSAEVIGGWRRGALTRGYRELGIYR